MRFAQIAPGSFEMGSPAAELGRNADETQHRVTLCKPFLMQTTHVTIAQWKQFVAASGYKTEAEQQGWGFAWTGSKWDKVAGASWRNPGFAQGDDHPVVDVSWNDAVAFCDWLSAAEHKHYRLPTEAEFEFCCRAGTQTAYFWGDHPAEGAGRANCADQAAMQQYAVSQHFDWSDGYPFTAPVGHFKPNAWGLYDMVGNAWEWCGDWYGKYPDGDVIDPTGPSASRRCDRHPLHRHRLRRPRARHARRLLAQRPHPRPLRANRDHEGPDFRNCIKGFQRGEGTRRSFVRILILCNRGGTENKRRETLVEY